MAEGLMSDQGERGKVEAELLRLLRCMLARLDEIAGRLERLEAAGKMDSEGQGCE